MEKDKKKAIDPKEKNTMFTIFTLFFPSLIITAIASYSSSIGMAIICIALFVYQAALLRRYVETTATIISGA